MSKRELIEYTKYMLKLLDEEKRSAPRRCMLEQMARVLADYAAKRRR